MKWRGSRGRISDRGRGSRQAGKFPLATRLADLVLGRLTDTIIVRDSLRDEPSHPIARLVRGILIVKSFAAAALLLCGLASVMTADDQKDTDKKNTVKNDTVKNDTVKKEAAVPAALNFTVKSLDGKEVALSKYQGKVVLVVNVASQCGATPQYAPLQDLQKTFQNDGLVVLGFPSNQFGQQEPGSAAEIQEFCTSKYNVTFDMFAKIDVNGEKADPFYQYLTGAETNPQFAGKIGWNFEKFLIGRDGKVVARFKTDIDPDSEDVVAAIKKELAKK